MKHFCNMFQINGVALIIFLARLTFSAVLPTSNPYDQCDRLLHIDCARNYVPEPNETVCCSDGKTYQNLCFFAQAKCQHFQLLILYTGHCKATTQGPGDSITLPTDGYTGPTEDPTADMIHFVFCNNTAQIVCDNDLDPVCGSDNVFYKNNCDFAKAKCQYPTLTIQELHICKEAQRRVRRLNVFI